MDIKISDIIKVIECCHRQGVREFQLNDLKLSFAALEAKLPAEIETPTIIPPAPERVKEDLEKEGARVKQEQMELLMLEDPFAYEQLILEKEINRG